MICLRKTAIEFRSVGPCAQEGVDPRRCSFLAVPWAIHSWAFGPLRSVAYLRAIQNSPLFAQRTVFFAVHDRGDGRQ